MELLDYQDIRFADKELSLWGQSFPLGIFIKGERLYEYTLKQYLGSHDVLLGQLEDENSEHPEKLARIYCNFLPSVVDTIDGWSLNEVCRRLETSPPRLFGEMYTADILSLILNIRIKGYGEKIAISSECPYCGYKINNRDSDEVSSHDFASVIVRGCETLRKPPLFKVFLEREYAGIKGFCWQPPKFKDIAQNQVNPLFSRISVLQSDDQLVPLSREILNKLFYRDINKLRQSLSLGWFGPEKSIPMDCPSCLAEWVAPLGDNWEGFYSSLLSPPRPNHKRGAVEGYLNEIDFFFRTGEQSPKIDVFQISPQSRDFWLNKLSEMYKKQKEEMDKSAAKSKSKKR
jgi:hypothetical protein